MSNLELDRLLSGFADGILSEEEESRLTDRLRSDADARKVYLRYMAMHSTLHWDYAMAATAEDEPVRVTAERRPRIRPKAFAAMAMAAVIAIGLIAFVTLRKPTIATIEFADGAVFQNDRSSLSLGSGDRIQAGTIRIESASGAAQLRLDDQSLITLEGKSTLSLADQRSGKHLELRDGRLTAKVSSQPRGKPLRIATSVAELEVLGTLLFVEADEKRTGIAVEEGLVRMRRLTDGRTIDVPAKHRSLATLRTNVELSLSPFVRPSTHWQLELAPSDSLTKGMVVKEGVVEAEPYIAGRSDDGMKVLRHGIAVNGQLVTLTLGSVMHVQYRSDADPTLFISTQRPDGDFGGNFEYRIQPSDSLLDSKGWRTAEVPVRNFVPVAKQRHREFRLNNNTVTKLLISVHGNTSLQVAGLKISLNQEDDETTN